MIAHSGSPNAKYSVHWKTAAELKSQVQQLARGLHCHGSSTKEQILCLKHVPWEAFTWKNIARVYKILPVLLQTILIMILHCYNPIHFTTNPFFLQIITCYSLDPPFKPVGNSTALPSPIKDMVMGDALHNVPYMQGLVSDEYGKWNLISAHFLIQRNKINLQSIKSLKETIN